MKNTRSMLLNILMHICFFEKLHNTGFTILEHCGFDFKNSKRLPQNAWFVRKLTSDHTRQAMYHTLGIKTASQKLSEIQMLSFNLLVLHSVRYYHTDGCVSIANLLNQTRKQKKVGGQGHDKELSSIRELFPADTCRHGGWQHKPLPSGTQRSQTRSLI